MVKRMDDPTPSVAGELERRRVESAVWEALAAVHDPEIPPLAITDLGIVERVMVTGDAVHVDLLPTFAGCPALDVIRDDTERAVGRAAGDRAVRGRDALRSHGLTPPGAGGGSVFVPLAALDPPRAASCPFCGSGDTVLESAFGPTLCRTTHFCRACRNPFEAFKPKTRSR